MRRPGMASLEAGLAVADLTSCGLAAAALPGVAGRTLVAAWGANGFTSAALTASDTAGSTGLVGSFLACWSLPAAVLAWATAAGFAGSLLACWLLPASALACATAAAAGLASAMAGCAGLAAPGLAASALAMVFTTVSLFASL